MTSPQDPIVEPFEQRVERYRRNVLPVVMWSVCAVIVAVMLVQRTAGRETIGIARAEEYKISSRTPATVAVVAVELFDEVRAGQVVATLDDAEVMASIATAQATIQQIRAELGAARIELAREGGRGTAGWTADLRRFQIDEEERRLAVLSLTVVIESDEIEHERLALETERKKVLLEEGLIGETEYDNTRLERDRIRKQIEGNRELLAQAESEYAIAQQRRSDFERGLPSLAEVEPLLQPLQEAVAVETARLAEITTQREALILRSPVGGRVSHLPTRPGQSVVAGEPVVMVSEPYVKEIVAYVNETEAAGLRANVPVRVKGRHRNGSVIESTVLRVGPTVEVLPERLWRNPQVPDYGRAVVIAASPNMKLIPGEVVEVSFSENKDRES